MNQTAYNLVWLTGTAIGALPALIYAFLKGEKISNRMGFVPSFLQNGIWIHGASVGESNETLVLAKTIRKTSNIPLILSSQTSTGYARLRKSELENLVAIQSPLDFFPFVKNAISRVRPKILVLLEAELWPNYILYSARSGTKIIWASAKTTGRTLTLFKKFPRLYTPVKNAISKVIMRDENDAEKFISVGFDKDKLVALGDLKFSSSIPEAFEPFQKIERHPIIVAGSIRKPELPIMLNVFQKLTQQFNNLLLIIAPRYPADFRDAKKFFENKKIKVHTRSRDEFPSHETQIFILDTIGELARMYSVADIALIGGSWFPAGGHNPLEATVWGIPIFAGPHIKNNKSIYDVIVSENACVIIEEDKLADAIIEELDSHRLLYSAQKVASEKIPIWRNIVKQYAELILNMV